MFYFSRRLVLVAILFFSFLFSSSGSAVPTNLNDFTPALGTSVGATPALVLGSFPGDDRIYGVLQQPADRYVTLISFGESIQDLSGSISIASPVYQQLGHTRGNTIRPNWAFDDAVFSVTLEKNVDGFTASYLEIQNDLKPLHGSEWVSRFRNVVLEPRKCVDSVLKSVHE